MSRQLGAEAAALLEARVREMGVRPLTGVRIRRIEARAEGLALAVDGREEPLSAGMVVAAGVRPRDELARDAGLDVARGSGGVVVDDELRTTDPAIHAIGECAAHDGVVYGLAAPGIRMAVTLAETLAGGRARFRGYTPAVRLRLPGIEVWSLGDQAGPGTRIRWSGYGSGTLRPAVAAAPLRPERHVCGSGGAATGGRLAGVRGGLQLPRGDAGSAQRGRGGLRVGGRPRRTDRRSDGLRVVPSATGRAHRRRRRRRSRIEDRPPCSPSPASPPSSRCSSPPRRRARPP